MFGVLGALEVRRDGELVPVPRGRQRAVLAALLVRPGRGVPIDELVSAVWGDDEPTRPGAALYTVVSRLRHTLGATMLRSGSAGYALSIAPVQVDAMRFAALRARAATTSPRVAAPLLDQALSLWRGAAYAEFADRDFVRPEAVRLEELRLATREDRAEMALRLGDPTVAISMLRSLLLEQPWREKAVELLVSALHQAGRSREALQYVRQYRRRLADELGLDPGTALRELELRILRQDVPGPVGPPRHEPAGPGWPVPLTAFVGRDADLAALHDAAAAHRLVTVCGTGGVGKTRLTVEALPELSARLGLPVTVVELGGVARGHADVAVAAALGLSLSDGRLRPALLEYLGVGSALLVLDGCEHLLAELRGLVAMLLANCSGVRLVATSRQRLGVPGERLVLLVPFPGSGTPSIDSPAVQMFTDRVCRLRPAFPVTEATVPAIAEICRRLDGLPLAIELAATRAATLGLGALRTCLDRGLDVLADDVAWPPGGTRSTDSGHEAGRVGPEAGLRAVVDWSCSLLHASDRRVLAALSVFCGTFDLHGAECVAAAVVAPGRSVATSLARLVDASLLTAVDLGGAASYRLLDIVRALTLDLLSDTDERVARTAHAQWAATYVERAARDAAGPSGADPLGRLGRHRQDISAAARWALVNDRPDLAGRIAGALRLCPHWRPDAELGALVTAVAQDAGVRHSPAAALALGAGGVAALDLGNVSMAEQLGRDAAATARTPAERYLALLTLAVAALYRGDAASSAASARALLAVPDLPPAYRADGHATLALLWCYHGRPATARREAVLARANADAAESDGYRAFATYAAGEVSLLTDPVAAAAAFRDAAALADRSGATQVSAVARIALAAVLTRTGRRDEALATFPALLDDLRRTGNWPQMWTALRILAETSAALGCHEPAALLLSAAEGADSAPTLTGQDVRRYRVLRTRIRRRIGGEGVERASVLAAALARSQVVDRAVTVVDQLLSRSPAGGGRRRGGRVILDA